MSRKRVSEKAPKAGSDAAIHKDIKEERASPTTRLVSIRASQVDSMCLRPLRARGHGLDFCRLGYTAKMRLLEILQGDDGVLEGRLELYK